MRKGTGSSFAFALCALVSGAAAGDVSPAGAGGGIGEPVDVTVYVIGVRPGAGSGGRVISLDVRQRPVAEAVREIGRQLGLGVVFDERGESLARRTVSAHVDHQPGVGVLDILLEDNGLEARVVGRVLSVSPAP